MERHDQERMGRREGDWRAVKQGKEGERRVLGRQTDR